MVNKKEDISNAQKLGIGVGLTTAAVAAVGAYFLYGSKDAVKNRKKVKGWALKAKGEVLEVLEKAEKITEGEFKDLVERVVKSYATVEQVSKKELAEFKQEMVENWDDLVKSGVAKVFSAQTATNSAVKAPAKKVATAAKKVVKKAMPKKAVAKKAVAKSAPATAKKVAPKKTA